jgi:hypothetical protein
MPITDPNEDYTGILIKDTYQSVIHIGGSGSYSSSLYDGTGSLVEIPWNNISSSVVNNISASDTRTFVQTEILSATHISNKHIPLSQSVTTIASLIFEIDGAPTQIKDIDYTYSSSTVTWDGYQLDGLLETGESVRISYLSNF